MMVVNSSEKQVNTNLRVPKADLDRFDEVAIARRMSRAALFRESILKTIEAYEKSQE
ncbi:MAG TPA: ribbon-helix-helix protein, CopG family [Methanocorpusculum sp.]|nr:ribbon-helix-helix protein, CopG family [Methanocorpusculum sp.]